MKTIVSVHVNCAILLLFQNMIFLPGKRNYEIELIDTQIKLGYTTC